MPTGQPAHFQATEAVLAKRHIIAASGVALHFAALIFAKFNSFWHQCHTNTLTNSKAVLLFLTLIFLCRSGILTVTGLSLFTASGRGLRAGLAYRLDLLAEFALINPHLYTDRSVGRARRGHTVIHIGIERRSGIEPSF